MSGEGPSTYAPRHLAAAGHRPRHRRAPGAIGAAAHLAPMAARALEAEEAAETPPLSRVHRGRAAVALSVTMAALPLLVLDNLPATASPSDGGADGGGAELAEEAPSTTQWVIETTTTEAPTTTAAPATTTSTTAAPPTTEAAAVEALRAPAPTTTVPPTTTTTAAPAPRPGDPGDPATWERLAQCESGGNWSLNSGNGYYGGLQFSLASWREVGGAGYPHQASKAEQIERGKILQARYGWGQWPYCSRQLGYR